MTPTPRELAKRIALLAPDQVRSASPEIYAEWLQKVADIIDDDRHDMPPIEMRLRCPDCGELHIDEGEFRTKPHHTHACQHCGAVWRPAVVPTVGVQFLPGFKNAPKEG